MTQHTAIGYSALIQLFALNVLPHYRASYIAEKGRGHSRIEKHLETHVYPKTYALKHMQCPFSHLEFALKYDGLNLEIISAKVHPIVIAATIAFGFVFIHPFEDGNGRIHRFLIHYILSKSRFTPDNIIFPVSAVMLQNMRDYDAALESFSEPLLKHITDYELSNDGALMVNQPTRCFYNYIDYTKFAEYLFPCIEETIETHFKNEIEFLINYDAAKNEIQNIIDMSDNFIYLFAALDGTREFSLKAKGSVISTA